MKKIIIRCWWYIINSDIYYLSNGLLFKEVKINEIRLNWLSKTKIKDQIENFNSYGTNLKIRIKLMDRLICKKVVDCVNYSVDDNSEFGCIITACKQLLLDRFQNSHVEFNRRQANRVAHELAQTALSNPSPHIFDDVPTCIWHILANEVQWFSPFEKS